jgi:hypothetical protein
VIIDGSVALHETCQRFLPKVTLKPDISQATEKIESGRNGLGGV